MASQYPKYNEDVYLPYARFLAENDRFEEAQKGKACVFTVAPLNTKQISEFCKTLDSILQFRNSAFHMAGHDAEALWVLEQLSDNAVKERRFQDAGYYNWLLSMQYLNEGFSDPQNQEKYEEKALKAECYYAYDIIHRHLV